MESLSFKVPASHMAARLAARHGRPYLAILGVVVLVATALGVAFDWRWILGVVMLLCVVVPGLLIYLYFYYALMPVTALNATRHTVSAGEDALVVAVESPAEAKEEEEEATEKECTVRTVRLPYGRLEGLERYGSAVILSFGPGKDGGWLLVPESAFADAPVFDGFVAEVKKKFVISPKNNSDESNPGQE